MEPILPPTTSPRPLWHRLLFCEDEVRLRAGWRLALFFLLLTLLNAIYAVVMTALTESGVDTTQIDLLLLNGVQLLIVFIAVLLARLLFDRRSLSSLGLRLSLDASNDVLIGFLIGGVALALVFFLELGLGWIRIENLAWQTQSLQDMYINAFNILGMFILAAFAEELMHRGYILQNLEAGLNTLWGVVLAAAVFASMHLSNPFATPLSFVGVFLAGLMLGYAYVRTRQLWLPLGLHIGWNFFEGVVFGFPVSGFATYRLIDSSNQVAAWLSGGDFGPEGGLILLPALALSTALVWLFTRRRESGTSGTTAAEDKAQTTVSS